MNTGVQRHDLVAAHQQISQVYANRPVILVN